MGDADHGDEGIDDGERAQLDAAFMALGAPGNIVLRFLQAVCDGRFHDAEVFIDENLRRNEDGFQTIAGMDFIAADQWGIFTGSEIIDGSRIEVWAVDTGGSIEPTAAPAGQLMRGLRFVLRHADDEIGWRIERIGHDQPERND